MSKLQYDKNGRLLFTKEMKKDYTILLPTMLPIHFSLIQNILKNDGYKAELLKNCGKEIISEGLKYVHNDTCYPAILVIGQFISALKSRKYDTNKVALMITQTGGGCRASNYIHLLRKALKKAGFEHVPVVSINLSGLEKNPGFSMSFPLIKKLISALVYGDMLMYLKNQVMPYEKNNGSTQKLIFDWTNKLSSQFSHNRGISLEDLKSNLNSILNNFEKIEVLKKNTLKVGIVGEIYIKYSSLGNNDLENFLMNQNCEVYVPGIINFMLFKIDNRIEDINLYGGNIIKKLFVKIFFNYFKKVEKIFINAIKNHSKFRVPKDYEYTKSLVKNVIGYGNKMGEGWLLTAEMLELIESGFENIVCAQPFGCLPNHICAKGMIRKIKEIAPEANIVAVDYDPGSSRVNQENRIKLMLSLANEKVLC